MAAKKRITLEVSGREVSISSPDKLYFPRAGHTKLDLVRYYLAVAEGAELPGRVDSHAHIQELGRDEVQVNLVGVKDEEQAIQRVVDSTTDTPPGEWIVGWGWDEGEWANRYPTSARLSVAFPDNPVVLRSLHGFAVWVNDKALAVGAGVLEAVLVHLNESS